MFEPLSPKLISYLFLSQVDAIVNSSNRDLDLRSGAISTALLKKAGNELQQECNRQKEKAGPDLIYILTKGYGLPCKYVFHGVLPTTYQKSVRISMIMFLLYSIDFSLFDHGVFTLVLYIPIFFFFILSQSIFQPVHIYPCI